MMKQLVPTPRQREPAINSITDTKHPLRLILWLGVIISRLLGRPHVEVSPPVYCH